MATKSKSDWTKASESYYSAKKTAKEQDAKASHLSSRNVRETYGLGFYQSKSETEAAEYSRKRRVAMADSEADAANTRASQASKKMDEISKRPPMSKKWIEK